MKTVITAKLDVTKIDKNRLFQGKTKAVYLDITLIPVENSKYDDDFMVVQAVSKEERLRGVKGPILGNARFFGGRPQASKPVSQDEPPFEEREPERKLPF